MPNLATRTILAVAVLSSAAYGVWHVATGRSSAAAPVVAVESAGGAAATSDHVHWLGDYGVVLRNHSLTRDAINVDVVAKFYAPSGKLVGSVGNNPNLDRITVVPAGTTFYFGELALTSGPIARVVATVRVGKTVPHRTALPQMKAAKLVVTQGKDRQARATLTNTTRSIVKGEYATSYAVYFDRSGNVVGGDPTGVISRAGTLNANVRPGQQADVDWELFVRPDVMSVKTTTDPGFVTP